jgi:hypothetical protein
MARTTIMKGDITYVDVPVDEGQVGTIYLLHYAGAIGNRSRGRTAQADHYLGWTEDYAGTCEEAANLPRIQAHADGTSGAKITRAFFEAGIEFEVVRIWHGTRSRERRLKDMGGHRRKCPACGITTARVR